MSSDDSPVAAIDCGTNSCRLLIVDALGKTLERHMRVTRLGEGVDKTGRLAPQAVRRTVQVLDEYRQMMNSHGVTRGRLVATSAARDAENSEEFFEAARRATSLEPELLLGVDEGRLSFTGATAHLPEGIDARRDVLVVDVGGGSTELVLGRPVDPGHARALSLDIGCVRVTERFLHHDPPGREELEGARRKVREVLSGESDPLSGVADADALIGLAGTVSTLATLDAGTGRYVREAVHHHRMAKSAVKRWLEVLSSESVEQRRRRPGIEPGREDVIVGGVLVLYEVMDLFDFEECITSEDDILDGLVAGLEPHSPA